jgi:hypothetical protein
MEIWGLKTQSFFDVWSLEHILSGVSIAAFSFGYTKKSFSELLDNEKVKLAIWVTLCIVFFWETSEHYLEEGLFGETVAYWFQGVEHWSNRIISDNLMIMLGFYIFLKFPKTLYPIRFLSLIWLLVHIFVFPHSMYLHELF